MAKKPHDPWDRGACHHQWVEGDGRDEDRYHCALCYLCLDVGLLLHRCAALEEVAEAAEVVVDGYHQTMTPEAAYEKFKTLRESLRTLDKGVGRYVYKRP